MPGDFQMNKSYLKNEVFAINFDSTAVRASRCQKKVYSFNECQQLILKAIVW